MNIKFFSFIAILSALIACKTDKSKVEVEHTVVVAPTNVTNVLEGTGVKDASNAYTVDPTQSWPTVNSFMFFKNAPIVLTYLDETLRDSVDLVQNDLLAIIFKKVEYGVNFKVESIDTKSVPMKINLSSIKNNEVKSSHRPGFMLSIPKSLNVKEPVIYLDSVMVGGMTFI
jgi:hypothetical protein